MSDIEGVEGLYQIIPLKILRKTKGVSFDYIPKNMLPKIDSVDRVIHTEGAFSPGSIEGVERPWYMHPFQDDNLMVLNGTRKVDIYTPSHGKVESFIVSPDYVKKNGELILEGPGMLVWPRNVFHRIHSCSEEGSISINFAKHYEGMDIKKNFNIYDLNTDSGEYKVIREGFLDQPDN